MWYYTRGGGERGEGEESGGRGQTAYDHARFVLVVVGDHVGDHVGDCVDVAVVGDAGFLVVVDVGVYLIFVALFHGKICDNTVGRVFLKYQTVVP